LLRAARRDIDKIDLNPLKNSFFFFVFRAYMQSRSAPIAVTEAKDIRTMLKDGKTRRPKGRIAHRAGLIKKRYFERVIRLGPKPRGRALTPRPRQEI